MLLHSCGEKIDYGTLTVEDVEVHQGKYVKLKSVFSDALKEEEGHGGLRVTIFL